MNDIGQAIEVAPLDYTELTAELVSAYVSKNHLQPSDLPALIATTHAALVALGHAGAPSSTSVEKVSPAQMRKSISPDHLISFEDGKPYKTLRRHLTLRGLSADAYRAKWGLPVDYPMTAASYSAQRSELARSLGLGQQRRKTKPAPEPVPAAEPPKKRGQKKTADVDAAG